MDILFLVSRVPYPLEKGDKLRAFHQLRLLSEHHNVTLVALADQDVHPEAEKQLRRYCSSLHIIHLSSVDKLISLVVALFTGKPFSSAYFYSKRAQKSLDRIIEQVRPAHIYCQLTRVCEYILHINNVPKTLDYQDAFAKGYERRIDREAFILRWLVRMEYRRLRKYEAFVLDKFQNTTIISTQDREFIDHPMRDMIVIVPNGVDTEFFHPMQVDKEFDLVFAGNMAYPPNVESVLFLVNEILPRVWNVMPNVKLLIAGATPVAQVRSLESSNVHVSGWVEDIRASYAQAKIFIAPMLIGTGLQNKLLEAMAMRLPCITSELANNALGGEHEKNILVCSSPEEYANAIRHLLDNPDAAAELAAAGYRFVRTNYGWEGATRPLFELIEST